MVRGRPWRRTTASLFEGKPPNEVQFANLTGQSESLRRIDAPSMRTVPPQCGGAQRLAALRAQKFQLCQD